MDSTDKHLYTYWDLIRDKRILVFTLRISFLWTVIGILYYTIAAQSLGYGGSMYFNYLVASLADIPAFFTTTYFANKVGRRITCMVGCLGAGSFLRFFIIIRYILWFGTLFHEVQCTREEFPVICREKAVNSWDWNRVSLFVARSQNGMVAWL